MFDFETGSYHNTVSLHNVQLLTPPPHLYTSYVLDRLAIRARWRLKQRFLVRNSSWLRTSGFLRIGWSSVKFVLSSRNLTSLWSSFWRRIQDLPSIFSAQYSLISLIHLSRATLSAVQRTRKCCRVSASLPHRGHVGSTAYLLKRLLFAWKM